MWAVEIVCRCRLYMVQTRCGEEERLEAGKKRLLGCERERKLYGREHRRKELCKEGK